MDETEELSGRAAALKAIADSVSDSDLPAADRRSRADALQDSRRAPLSIGDAVAVQGERGLRTVLGHGRGRGWILLCWAESSAECIGTIQVARVTK